MKKIIICAMILALANSSFSQQNNSKQVLTQEEYLKKSKNQKTLAWIFAGGGVALITTGLVIGNQVETSFDEATNSAAFIIIGAIPAIASIPLFIASAKNKKRAIQITAYLKSVNVYTFRGPGIVRTYFPACSLKMKL